MLLSKSEVGGKGFHLQTMQNGGLPVPQFYCVSWSQLKQLLAEGNPDFWFDVNNEMAAVFSNYQLDLEVICLAVQKKIKEVNISEPAWADFSSKIHDQFGEDYLVSVRSSAIDEDSVHTSFAGQHVTELFVGPSGLLSAIKNCLASAWSFGAISYRFLHNLPVHNIQFAIVIQRMVNASKSGIGFSMDITRNLTDSIITAGYGLGEGVVADKVECDTFRIHRTSKAIETVLVKKQTALRWNQINELNLENLDPILSEKPCLSNQEIDEVFEVLQQAEALLKSPADVEFSFDERGALYVLQMRPITTLDSNNIEILDNTNIVESYPGITLPLSFTFAKQAYQNLFENSARFFWIDETWVKQHQHVFEQLIAHPYGRVYYRLDNWYRLTAMVYNSPSAMKAWESAVGLSQPIQVNDKPSTTQKLKIILAIVWIIVRFRQGNRRFFKSFAVHYSKFKNFRNQAASPAELWPYFQKIMQQTYRDWPLTVVNDFLAFKVFGWLQSLIKRWGISENEEFANELISGYGEVDSELAVVHLLQLKEQILQDDKLYQLIRGETGQLLDFVGSNPEHPFSLAWHAYLDRFGDRTFAELKLETVTPKQNPTLLIDLIKSQIDSTLTADTFIENSKKLRIQAWQSVKHKLGTWNPKYWIFNWVANLAAFGVMSRENMRFCRTRMYGASREIFLQIGSWMQEDGFIVESTDVFYLTMDELQDYCLYGSNCAIDGRPFNALVSQRKMDYIQYEEIDLPDRIVFQQNDLPIFQPKSLSSQSSQTTENIQSWQGVAVSKGTVESEVVVMLEPNLTADVRGKVLVSKMTDPGWVFLMSQASALISEKGSLLSHTAIVGRELGIPVVVAIPGITKVLKTGDKIRVNGSTGVVERC